MHRSDVHIGNAPRQRFTALLHQVQRGRSEQQELPEALSIATALVNDASQDFKQTRHAVDLIQDDQLVALGAQKAIGVVQPQTVGWTLQSR